MNTVDVQLDFVLEILIVEDELSFALELQMLVEQLGYKSGGIVDNAKDALMIIKDKQPDAILMDIDLKGPLSGLDLAEQVSGLKIPILFITSYQDNDTYERAREMNLVGFLVKPLNDLTLLSAIDACLKELKNQHIETESMGVINNALLFKKGKIYHKINLDDIAMISSDLEYITVETTNGKFVTRESLKTLEKLMANLRFFRCHQRHIINLNHLVSVDVENQVAHLKTIKNIPFSRRNRKLLLEKFIQL